MSLAKERTAQDSHMGLIQACSFYENVYGGGGSSVQIMDPALGLHGVKNHQKSLIHEEGEGLMKISTNGSVTSVIKNYTSNRLPLLSDHSNVNCNINGFVFQASNSSSPPGDEAKSLINFKTETDHYGMYSSGSLLSFEQKLNDHDQEDYSIWADTVDHYFQWNHHQLSHKKYGTDSRLSKDLNCFETASGYDSMDNSEKEIQEGEERFRWLYSGMVDTDPAEESGREATRFLKRPPHTSGDMQASKKQCTGASRKPKPKSIPSKDPQSIAAKNRRERISERLKILQDLVPNGTKVDLVTMLEKAMSYVKFLQLQVKVLATDEFWPAQGGKAPEVGQVKEAIEAILSSHKMRNTSSK